MKNFTTITLTFALALAALTGCSGNAQTTEEAIAELRIEQQDYSVHNGPVSEDPQALSTGARCDNFCANACGPNEVLYDCRQSNGNCTAVCTPILRRIRGN